MRKKKQISIVTSHVKLVALGQIYLGCILVFLFFFFPLHCHQVHIKLQAGGVPGGFSPSVPRGGLGKPSRLWQRYQLWARCFPGIWWQCLLLCFPPGWGDTSSSTHTHGGKVWSPVASGTAQSWGCCFILNITLFFSPPLLIGAGWELCSLRSSFPCASKTRDGFPWFALLLPPTLQSPRNMAVWIKVQIKELLELIMKFGRHWALSSKTFWLWGAVKESICCNFCVMLNKKTTQYKTE